VRKNYRRESCADDRRSVVAERNRYFTGKYMTARDFMAEQDYFLSRHRLHNRLLHGWGIACGFGVTRHPDPTCTNWVVVGPGIALDCHGRELVLCGRTAYELKLPVEIGKPAKKRRFLLCAAYCEESVECVPVIYDEPGCDPRRREPNRVRETVRLELHSVADLDPGCWAVRGGGPAHQHDDCDQELPAAGGGCLEPDCVCKGLVPLALITKRKDGSVRIRIGGRRRLPSPPESLTQVCATSWRHGATVSVDELLEAKGQLRISFNRKIAPAKGIATGINAETLIVQHAGEGDDLEYVPYDTAHPPQLVDGRHAVYTIWPGFLSPRRRGGLVGSTIHVTLLADFVLDCHQRPVDGDHIGGRLPSGNGLPGGTFHSWFRIGSDRPSGTPTDEKRDQETEAAL
jgi:hypothetical protein